MQMAGSCPPGMGWFLWFSCPSDMFVGPSFVADCSEHRIHGAEADRVLFARAVRPSEFLSTWDEEVCIPFSFHPRHKQRKVYHPPFFPLAKKVLIQH